MITFNELVQKLLRFTYANLTDVSQDTGNALALLAGGGVLLDGSYVFVLDDSFPSPEGNVFNSWASLYAAGASSTVIGPRLVQVVGTSHITPGVEYNLDGWTFEPGDEFSSELVIDNGVTFKKTPGGLTVRNGLTVQVNASAPVITDTGPGGDSLIIVHTNAAILCASDTGPLLKSSGASVFVFEQSQLGDGSHQVVTTNGGSISGYCQIRGASILAANGIDPLMTLQTDASSAPNGFAGPLIYEDNAGQVTYNPDNPDQWGGTAPSFVGGNTETGALDLLAAVLSNHAQVAGFVGATLSPVATGVLNFTCEGSGLIVRVWATCDASSSAALIDNATLSLQLDGATVAGAPTPAPSIAVGGRTESSIFWDVTFPDNASHALRLLLTTAVAGGTSLTIQQYTIRAQELLA